jgi:hypothetical protein
MVQNMSNSNKIWMWVAAALLCTTIASAYMALNYQSQLKRLETQHQELLSDIDALQGSLNELTILIDVKIDYGNNTIVWYNNTRVPFNSDLLIATQVISKVEYSTGEFGAFVTEINDVGGDADKFWLWHYYDKDVKGWQFGPVASDAWVLHNGDKVSWIYSGF